MTCRKLCAATSLRSACGASASTRTSRAWRKAPRPARSSPSQSSRWLIVVGIVLRSYWSVALVGGALAILIVWLKGISNLVGLDGSIIMSFIVPIAMISFGVDFAFHAIGRYREEASESRMSPGEAYVAGLAAVSAALLLALASDSLAFLSNVTSGIPAIIQFGIGASIALASAYLILGVVTPLALMRVESLTGGSSGGPATLVGRVASWAAVGAAALTAGFTVLFLVFFPFIGAPMLAVYLAVFIAAPLWIASRRDRADATPSPSTAGGSWQLAGRLSHVAARARFAVLPGRSGLLRSLRLVRHPD